MLSKKPLTFAFTSLCSFSVVWAQESPPPANPEPVVVKGDNGQSDYVPSKLEWLRMDAQLLFGQRVGNGNDFEVNFSERYPNTLLIEVRYLKNVARENMNTRIAEMKAYLLKAAALRKWNWLQLDTNIEAGIK